GEQTPMAQPYGEELGKVMEHLTSLYGLPPYASLTVVQTEAGTPNGYAGPGLLFLSPRAIGKQVNTRLLANQISRQWWGILLSPKTRNDLWIANGLARYSEMLYLEQVNGPAALEAEVRDAYIEALTVDNPALGQASSTISSCNGSVRPGRRSSSWNTRCSARRKGFASTAR
ncbi:MAG: hypothetical protein NT090_15980, partial [Acidobacteria bacterium]|nr:hypothetical protein [Acidobacteriota bacterium]